MKQPLLYVTGVFLTFLLIAACNHNSKKEKEAENRKPENQVQKYYKRLEGAIGDRKAVLQLVKYQSLTPEKGAFGRDQYRGVFLDGADEMPLELAGYKISDSVIQLVTYDHYNPVDTFRGQFSKGSFTGTLRDTLGRRLSFKFEEAYPDGSFHWEVATYRDSLFYDSSKTNGAQALTNLATLWPGRDIEASSKAVITDSISRGWFGMSKTFQQPDALLQAVSDTFLQQYRQATDEWKKNGDGAVGPSFHWNEQADVDVIYNADSINSLRFTQYQFTGGAHGLQSVFCLVMDMKKGRVLQLTDIFKEGYEPALQATLEQELRVQYDIPEGASLNGEKGILFNAHLPISSNFYLTGQGIGFVYNPYDVAPYVVGKIDLYIPFSKISGLLRE